MMDTTIHCADLMFEDSNASRDHREHLSLNYEECTSTIIKNLVVQLETEPLEHIDTEIGQSKLKLIPALKGGRKQNGLNVQKLTVTWSPDVYDPPITSRPHFRQQGSRSGMKSFRIRRNKHKDKHSTKSPGGKFINKKSYRKFVRCCHMLPLLPIGGCEMICGSFNPASLVNLAVPKQGLMCGGGSFGSDVHESIV